MNRRVTIIGTVLTLSLAVSVSAQDITPEAVQREGEAQLRQQRQIFEGVLQMAVRQGAQEFVRLQAPDLSRQIRLTANDPQARGFVPPHGGGLLFYVGIPNIRGPIAEMLVEQLRPRRQEAQPRPAGNIRPGPVSNASGVAGAIAPPDPVTVAPDAAGTPVIDDGRCGMRAKPSHAEPTLDFFYTVSVCDALMDAMLENSRALPIRDNEWLTVMAVPEADGPGVIDLMSGNTTYLEIKGEDLLAYRQGKLTKEQARKAIVMNVQ